MILPIANKPNRALGSSGAEQTADHARAVFGYCRCKENLLCMKYETKSVCKTFSQIDATLRVESNEPN